MKLKVHAKLHENLFISACSLNWNIKKIVEKFVKNFYVEKHSFIELTHIVYQQHMILKLRKPI